MLDAPIETVQTTWFNRIYDEARQAFFDPRAVDPEIAHVAATNIMKMLSEMERSGNHYGRHLGLEPTLFEEAEELRSHAFGGWKRYAPRPKDRQHNDLVTQLSEFVPETEHYKMNGIFTLDNMFTGASYGLLAGGTVILGPHFDETRNITDLIGLLGQYKFELGVVGAIGTLTGSIGMTHLRNYPIFNKKEFQIDFNIDRSDSERAHIWDSTQFIDAIAYIARKGLPALETLHKQIYVAPEYSILSNKWYHANRTKAENNLVSNPFIQRVGITVASAHRYHPTLEKQKTHSTA